MLTLIAIFFGFLFFALDFVYNGLAATPLKPFANDMLLGMWVMAGPLAGYLIRKPGASFSGEFLGAFVEMIIGSQLGVSGVILGIVQGIGTELGFAFTGYKYWHALSLTFSAITTTVITFGYDLFASGYNAYGIKLLVILFFIRLISIGLFGGVLANAIIKLVEKAGILHH